MLQVDDVLGLAISLAAAGVSIALLAHLTYLWGGRHEASLQQTLIEAACNHAKIHSYLRLLSLGAVLLLATAILWALSLLQLVPESVRDFGVSSLILLALVLVLRLMWVAVHAPPLSEAEQQEIIERQLPEVVDRLWMAPAARQSVRRDRD